MPAAANFLMCPPDFFGIEYAINPWMAANAGNVDKQAAASQWQGLRDLLQDRLGATVDTLPPAPESPDMVFTSDAGLVIGNRCILARFRHSERRTEEPHHRRWFAGNGYELSQLPDDVEFEGTGDAMFDGAVPDLLWVGCGIRSHGDAHTKLAQVLEARVVSLTLVDPRFFHLDTCFCPLPGGLLAWYPPALGEESRRVVEKIVPEWRRFAVSEEAAVAFLCNAVGIGEHVVAGDAPEEICADLRRWLAERGRILTTTPLSEFIKAGGSAKCLTLKLH